MQEVRMTGRKSISVTLILLVLLFMPLQAVLPNFELSASKKSIIQSKYNLTIDGKEAVPKIIIAIDPGHGGIDTGAAKGHVVESEVTLDIAKKLKSCMENKSYSVIMTRSSDISLYMLSDIEGTNQRRELNARANIINNSGATVFVSIHVNSYPEFPKMSGSIIYYNPFMPQAKELSGYIQEKLNSITVKSLIRETGVPQKADFYILMNSHIPGVLVETAFLSNADERKLLMHNEFRLQIAKAIANGIDNYFIIQGHP
jgi:N-acetylmuramoyl-L-alanine amidase